MLPSLAELYGVTADDILAGETLNGRRQAAVEEELTARKKRLLARLRTRFDVCFVIALALAALAFWGIPYVSPAAVPLSVAVVWVGFVLAAHPIRYGGVETGAELWQNMYRKLLIAAVLQWWALLRMAHFGKDHYYDAETMTVRYDGDVWKPLMFCTGVLIILAALSWGLRRADGAESRLLSRGWRKLVPWLMWGALFLTLWRIVDDRFDAAMAPWIAKYGENVMADSRFDTLWPKLKARRDMELLPYLRARRAVAAMGCASGLGLLGWTVWPWARRKKEGGPLAE